jgi:hypothetical protein
MATLPTSLHKIISKHLFFSSTHNNNAYQVVTTALQKHKFLKTLHLAGLEPENFCSVSGRDDHDATPKATLLTYIVLPW